MNTLLETVKELALEKDENHWIISEDVDLNDHDEVIELIQTGSVTTTVAGIKYIIELQAFKVVEPK